MKKTKIIIPALGLLVLSTAASVTGTVAWFSANATVTASSLSVTARVDANLFIKDGIESDITAVTGTSTTLTGTGVTASSVNPVDFDSTSGLIAQIPATYSSQPDVSAAGTALTWTTVANLSSGTSGQVTGVSTYVPKDYFAYGYVTIVRKQSSAASFNLTAKADVTFGTASELNKAFRIGILVDDGTFYESGDFGVNTASTLSGENAVKLNNGGSVGVSLADNQPHVALLLAWFEGADSDCFTNNAVNISTNTVSWSFTSANA